ncbi:MAG: lipocalin family protein [Clostridiaceae bacterium]|nr:lipocalin family protein [Clostridiaceae bacterium]
MAQPGYHRRHILFVASLLLFLVLTAACGINQDLLGTWQLIDAGGTAFDPQTQFEFRDGRELLVTPHTPGVTLTYTSSPGGDLSITTKRTGSGSFTLKMTYDLKGDKLSITDEDGFTLVFQRLDDPAP